MAKELPKGILVIFQIIGDESYNEWNRQLSLQNLEKGQEAVFVEVEGFRKRSLLENMNIKRAVT